ncbi:MAG: DNA primase [Gammaproteobacteria bacterium]|nr:DNA primase [Gammaproteobacteria bacterium]
MSGRIPQDFIDELIARADIVDVVGSRVSLKKAGRDHQGLCPFHDEKTPSFTVSPSKGFYHCFGCGAHGTAIGFLMNYENLGFPQAVEALADMLGMDMPAGAADGAQRREDGGLLALLKEADQIYRRALRDHPHAIEYLKQRGIDGATAGRFGIGYSPDAWDTVLRALGRDEARTAQLIEAGLVIRNDKGRCYDRFRDRIMFPIRSPRGDVIGFGGRVVGAGEPKYLNSPETAVFHKGQALYGLYESRGQHGRPEQIVVVEGYLDVASLAQHGVGPAVATLGTATTPDHVRRLTRLADRIVFCFDGDRAGRAAAWRALETSLPFAGGNVELKFLLLPEGEDPDSLVRSRGGEEFRRLLGEAQPLSQFLIEELNARADPRGVDGRARLIAQAKPLLARLSPGVYRELLLEELARLAGIEAPRLAALIDAPGQRSEGPRPAQPPRPGRKRTRIGRTITLVLHYPAAVAAAGPVEGLDEVDEPGAPLLRQLLEIAADNPNVKSAQLVERFREEPDGKHVDRLAREPPPPLEDEGGAPAMLRDSLERIVQEYAQRRQKRQAVEALKRRPAVN